MGRLALLVVAALVAVAAVGATAQGGGAGRLSQILFQAPGPDGVSFVLGPGSGHVDSIALSLQPAQDPLPQRLVVQMPAGYALDLSATPGTAIAPVLLVVFGDDLSSLSLGYGSLVAQDPQASASDPVAQACAPGLHAAVWSASIPMDDKQTASMTIFVDAGGPPGVAFTLQACPTGLAKGATDLSTVLELILPSVLQSPSAPGTYLWRALVTPQAAPQYELQSVVPLPESATFHAAYDAKRGIAVFTGRVIESGKPLAGAEVQVEGDDRRDEGGTAQETHTGADGRYTIRARTTRTTDFTMGLPGKSEACTATSTAPGGCLASATVQPDGGFHMVWVSVRGGAARVPKAADQRLADREVLATADFPAGFAPTDPGLDLCQNQTHEPGITIRGESSSPQLVAFRSLSPPVYSAVNAITRVYATVKQARAAFAHEAVTASMKCEAKANQLAGAAIAPLKLVVAPARMRGFRILPPLGEGQSGSVDLVYVQRGRSVGILVFSLAGAPDGFEQDVVAKLAARLR